MKFWATNNICEKYMKENNMQQFTIEIEEEKKIEKYIEIMYQCIK